ncbi:MAG: phosphopyruvate hydratase [Clostridiales bacterium]|nr:phosphopyruvate hydratase [Clostridiales bacterium]
MKSFFGITDITAREILDSRGNPTIEAEVVVEDSITACASVPSGASTGSAEARELRDGGERYHGRGTQKAVGIVKDVLSELLIGRNVLDQVEIDQSMIDADGSEKKEHLGANSILSVSLACAKAAAKALEIPFYQYLGGMYARTLPVPMMNILNGGRHANNCLDFQEFMILPTGAPTFSEALQMGSKVYHCLKKILEQKKFLTAVGDEGGFAPDIGTAEEALDLMVAAVEMAGYEAGREITFALDIAASELKDSDGQYVLKGSGNRYTADEMIGYYESLIQKYPIISIEDGLDEEDWKNWEIMTRRLSIQLVGDDLFATNPKRLKKGISCNAANALLVKLNQIGTLTEAVEAVELAQRSGYRTVVSHRSGETEDTWLADFAVAFGADFIKCGAPCRGERLAKYNRLLRIEEELYDSARYGRI